MSSKNRLSLQFTPSAASVLERAHEEARQRGQDVVRQELILLSLMLVHEGDVMPVLGRLHVDPKEIIDALERLIPPRNKKSVKRLNDITLSSGSRAMLKRAENLSSGWRDRRIGTTAIFLALIHKEGSRANDILSGQRVTFEKVERIVSLTATSV